MALDRSGVELPRKGFTYPDLANASILASSLVGLGFENATVASNTLNTTVWYDVGKAHEIVVDGVTSTATSSYTDIPMGIVITVRAIGPFFPPHFPPHFPPFFPPHFPPHFPPFFPPHFPPHFPPFFPPFFPPHFPPHFPPFFPPSFK